MIIGGTNMTHDQANFKTRTSRSRRPLVRLRFVVNDADLFALQFRQ